MRRRHIMIGLITVLSISMIATGCNINKKDEAKNNTTQKVEEPKLTKLSNIDYVDKLVKTYNGQVEKVELKPRDKYENYTDYYTACVEFDQAFINEMSKYEAEDTEINKLHKELIIRFKDDLNYSKEILEKLKNKEDIEVAHEVMKGNWNKIGKILTDMGEALNIIITDRLDSTSLNIREEESEQKGDDDGDNDLSEYIRESNERRVEEGLSPKADSWYEEQEKNTVTYDKARNLAQNYVQNNMSAYKLGSGISGELGYLSIHIWKLVMVE